VTAADQLLVGAAIADITPPYRCRLAGFPERMEAWDRIHDRPQARVVVLRKGEVLLCVVSLDVMAVDRSWTESLRRRALDELGIDPRGLMVAATHTHSTQAQLLAFDGPLGPAVEALFGESEGPTDEALRAHLASAVTTCLEAALSRLEPAVGRAGSSTVEGIGSNRRRPGDPVDPRCLFIGFETPQGTPIASLVHYACHPTVLGEHDLGISADFPGVALRALDERLGGVALFLNGCLGDVSTRDARRSQSYEEVERFGALLAGFVEEARTASGPFVAELGTTQDHIALPPKPRSWADGADERVTRLRAELDVLETSDAAHGEVRRMQTALEGALLTQRLAVPLQGLSTVDLELQLLQLSAGLRLAGVPAELSAELGLELSRQVEGTTAVVGPANGYLGYIGSRHGYDEGGYEADCSLVAPGAGELLIEAIRDRIVDWSLISLPLGGDP
jgi:hypothetical protein